MRNRSHYCKLNENVVEFGIIHRIAHVDFWESILWRTRDIVRVLVIRRKEAAQLCDQKFVIYVLTVGVIFDIQVPAVDKDITEGTGRSRGYTGISVGVPESKCDAFRVGLGIYRATGPAAAYAEEDFLARRLAGLDIGC